MPEITKLGRCYDCSQGYIMNSCTAGFTLQSEGEGDAWAFWYCNYCGSNHVTILDAGGKVLAEQDDLYPGRSDAVVIN